MLWDDDAFLNANLRAAILDLVRSTTRTAFPDGRLDSAALRRARAYIDQHAQEPLRTTDVAAAARLSVRGLHALFQREVGEPPMTYVRRIRLEQTRIALQAADASETTVGAVAAQWGFSNLGRFGKFYSQACGTCPSDDLRH